MVFWPNVLWDTNRNYKSRSTNRLDRKTKPELAG